MMSLVGGIVAIVLGVACLIFEWFGQRGIVFLLKGLVAVVPALLVLGGCVAVGAGLGSIKDKMKCCKEDKKEEKAEEKPAVEEKPEKEEEKKEEA